MAFNGVDGLQDMDAQPPPLLPMEQQQQALVDLDHQFGNMLCRLMDGQISAADAVKELKQHSASVVQHYRAEAADELNPAAHRINISTLAAELQAQAASWQLLEALYCTDGMPAGVYEGASGVGNRLTMRQLLADTVNGDDGLRRFAQVVMWLEALAAQQLPDPLRDPSCRFGPQEGVWKETLRALGGSTRHGSSESEVDPDAVSRDQLKLALADRQAGAKLAAWAWRLVRAGRFKDASELCSKAGQPWRAVSVGGAGPWGPLPVGPAAEAAAHTGDKQDPAEEVAAEVEGGAATARLAWRWACYAAAAAAGPAEDGEGGNKYEAALYGALCGDVRHMLPACDSWEDEAWAYCRAWLELQADAQLLQDCRDADSSDPEAQAAAQEFYLGAAGDAHDALEVPQALLEGFVDLAARSGYSQRPSKQLLREGLSVMHGDWPLPRLGIAGQQLCVPTTFKELQDLLTTSSNSSVSTAAQHSQHLLQVQLMSEDWQALALQLMGSSKAADQALQQHKEAMQQQGQPPAAAAGADAGGSGDVLMHPEEYEGGGGGGGVLRPPQMSREACVDVLRFNAHLALALRALGLLPDPLTVPDDTDELHMLQQVLSRVICRYASYLACEGHSLYLVPAYLCHLRLPERRALSTKLLQTALDTGMSEQDAESVALTLSAGTEFWFDRQCRQQEEGGSPDNQLYGDLRPEEGRLLLQHNVYQTFSSARSSPASRCNHLRWMYYSFSTAAREAAAAAAQDPQLQQLTWQGGWADALVNTLGLATQLALNPGGPGLTYLLQDVVPQHFVTAATTAAAAAAGEGGDAAGCSSAVSSAAGVNVVEAAGQLQVQRQLLALSFWQHYAALEARYRAWQQQQSCAADDAAGAAEQLGGGGGEDALLLVQDMLQLAGADALRLPAPAGLCSLLHDMAAAVVAGGGEPPAAAAAAAVTEGDWLCLPQYDASVNRLMLEAYAEGSVEQVLGLLPYNKMELAVTAARQQPELVAAGAGIAAGDDAALPYNTLEPYEVPVLQSRVEAHLHAATASFPDVSFSTGLPTEDEPLLGCLLIKMRAFTRSSSTGSRVLDSRELQAWQDMVAVVVGLMDAGSKSGAASAGGVDEEGDVVPRLNVVYLNSSLSTQLAISRRRTTSKLLRRSAKVLQALTASGYRGPEVDDVLLLVSDGDEAQGLLGQLSQRDAAQLLQRLTHIVAVLKSGSS